MFYLLRKSFILQLLAALATLAIGGYFIFSNDLSISYIDTTLPAAQSLSVYLMEHPAGAKAILFIAMLLQGGLFFRYFRNSGFLDEENLLPIFFFLAFLMGMGIFVPVSTAWIMNLSVLILLNINGDIQGKSAKTATLLSGLFIGIASLYDIAAFLLLVCYLLLLLINRLEKMKEMLVAICGLLITYIYVFSYYFFKGNLTDYLHSFRAIHFNFPIFTQTHFSLYAASAAVILILSLVYIIGRLTVYYDNTLIVMRKIFLSLCLLAIFQLIMMVCSNIPFPYSLGYLIIPLTCFFISFIPSRNFSISTELLLCLYTASLVVLAIL
ncbi:MAG: hypothetical protein MJZ49_00850 [Bacteroidales bacterium]|nr:hypothetical protein [Bacteroidales bacterium]